MKHGDKVYYHRRHHVKKPATWLCWTTRGDRRLAVMGLSTIKHKRLSNAEQRRLHQKGQVARRN